MEYNKVKLSDFCCKTLFNEIRLLKEIKLLKSKKPNTPYSVVYDIAWRILAITPGYPRKRFIDIIACCRDITYCPWCGTKLPKGLVGEWHDILEKEYNIKDPMWDERKKVPAEFWTDEWWKKRGL